MADGYRFQQQIGGNYYYPQHHSRHIARNGSPPNNIRSAFNTETPSPSRSPDLTSPGQNLYGMFGQTHQQGQHGRINGAPNGQRMPVIYNFQHQNPLPQQQQPTQHHQNLEQDLATNSGSGNILGHHTSYSSGMLSNATPNFTPSSLQNGHSATTRGGQAQQITEHWAEQLKLHKETERAHAMMIEQHAPNYYARTKGHENRSIPSEVTATNLAINAAQDEVEDRGRPSNLEGSVKRQDWHNMDMSGQGIRILTTPLFTYTFLNDLYIASNKISQLPPAIGKLRQLRHLDASNNALTELPPELGMCVYLKQLLVFDNSIRTLPNEIGSLYQLEMLGIEGNPLDAAMKQEIMEHGTKALVTQLREQAPVPLPPASRLMLDLQDGAPASANQDRFKVFSWNTLCDKYATNQQYGYTPTSALAWEYRKEQILQEIQSSEADIICLQEVDMDSFKEFFSMKLAYSDYKGVFWPKTRARTMFEKDAKVVDGCATFYKGSKYILLDKQLIDFANIAINRPDMKNQHDIFNRVMPRDDIAVVTFFEERLTGSRIIVVNAHIFWNPVYADVKVIQTAILMENLTKLADKYVRFPPCKDKKTYTLSEENDGESQTPEEPLPEPAPSMEYTSSTQLPLVICGDFNSLLGSGVHDLLAHGSVRPDHTDLNSFQYGSFTRDGIQHPFSLRSSYASLNGTPEALPFTNYTPGFTGVIDYIWYSTNALEVTALLGPVDAEYMKRVPGFPNYHFPSDHLSLLAEFSVKGRKEKKVQLEPDFGPQRERRN